MTRILFYFVILLSSFISSAQKNTLYYNDIWVKTDESQASYYRVYEKQDTVYKVDDYFMNGKLYRSGYRTSITSNCYVYRIGPMVVYDSAGHKIREGNYAKNGLRIGRWKYYDQHTSELCQEEEYEKGARQRSWSYHGHDTSFVETKRSDELSTISHYLNNHLIKRQIIENDSIVSTTCYDEHRVKITCPTDALTYDIMPSAKYNMAKYLNENLHYPKQAQEKGTEGRVLVKFIVDVDGSITDVVLHKGIGDFCDQEAMRVVAEMPSWNPGTQNGVPVPVYFTLPINFKLTD